ncbi:MAG: hypothetical protein DDT34_02557 [Firmicutes bacterium]|nr:hypothetical protein [Bacillota bacterium]
MWKFVEILGKFQDTRKCSFSQRQFLRDLNLRKSCVGGQHGITRNCLHVFRPFKLLTLHVLVEFDQLLFFKRERGLENSVNKFHAEALMRTKSAFASDEFIPRVFGFEVIFLGHDDGLKLALGFNRGH